MASRGSDVAVTLCPACLMVGEHQVGQFKAVVVNGALFDAGTTDSDALAALSEGFKTHTIAECGGEISHACVKEYAEQELAQPESPLSRLFATRIRSRKCPSCGYLTKLSRLP